MECVLAARLDGQLDDAIVDMMQELKQLMRAYETAVVLAARNEGHDVGTFKEAIEVIDKKTFEELRESYRLQLEELQK